MNFRYEVPQNVKAKYKYAKAKYLLAKANALFAKA